MENEEQKIPCDSQEPCCDSEQRQVGTISGENLTVSGNANITATSRDPELAERMNIECDNARNQEGNGCCIEREQPHPDPMQEVAASRTKNVSIAALDYGYNVTIGCQSFAVESVEKLIKNLEAYLNDPVKTERRWLTYRELL